MIGACQRCSLEDKILYRMLIARLPGTLARTATIVLIFPKTFTQPPIRASENQSPVQSIKDEGSSVKKLNGSVLATGNPIVDPLLSR